MLVRRYMPHSPTPWRQAYPTWQTIHGLASVIRADTFCLAYLNVRGGRASSFSLQESYTHHHPPHQTEQTSQKATYVLWLLGKQLQEAEGRPKITTYALCSAVGVVIPYHLGATSVLGGS